MWEKQFTSCFHSHLPDCISWEKLYPSQTWNLPCPEILPLGWISVDKRDQHQRHCLSQIPLPESYTSKSVILCLTMLEIANMVHNSKFLDYLLLLLKADETPVPHPPTTTNNTAFPNCCFPKAFTNGGLRSYEYQEFSQNHKTTKQLSKETSRSEELPQKSYHSLW